MTVRVVKSTISPKVINSKVNFSMDTTRFRWNQSPVESTDGANKVFTLPNSEAYVSGLLEVFIDGIKQTITTDYAETTSTTFTFGTAPASDETVILNYITQ